MKRRDFFRTTGGAALCTLSGYWGGSGCSGACVSNIPIAPDDSYLRQGDQITLSLSDIDELKPVGGAVRLLLDDSHGSDYQILLAHVEEGDYRAYPNQCTHKGKELDFLPHDGILRCCSGHSDFELSGEVIEGKASEALQLYEVLIEEDKLIILL